MKFSKFNLLVPNCNNNQQYLFNTFNGSCLDIDNATADIIKAKDVQQLDKETMTLFTKTGILIKDAIDENNVFSYMFWREKYGSKHITATILLTWACNLNCVYCFQDRDKCMESMSQEYADRCINFIKLLATDRGAKSVSIMLFGGEPLVNIDVGYYILECLQTFCNDNNMSFSSAITTNGTLLSDDIICKLYEYKCKIIQVTLDGVKEVHDARRMYHNGEGSFDSTLNALRLLNEKKDIRTVIRVNIDKVNINEAYKLLEYIGKKGEKLTNCTVDFGIVRGETSSCSGYSSNCFAESEIGDVLYDLWNYAEMQGFKYNIRPIRRNMYCGLYGDNQYTIAPNCDLYKCWEHVGQNEHLMGKINEKGSFTNVTHSFFDWMTVDPLKNDECEECVYLPTCGGGCGVISYNELGTYHAKGCFKVKGTIEKQVIKYVESIMKAKCSKDSCSNSPCNNEDSLCVGEYNTNDD